MPLKGEVRQSPEQSARQPIARSGKFVRRCLFAEGVGLWKDDGLMLSPIVKHTSVRELVGGRGKIWRGIPQWNTKDQLPKPLTATVATAQWTKWSRTYPNNPGERTASTEQISKKGIKLILKTIGNRKGDRARSCSRWQTQREKICKLQRTNQYNVRSEWHWLVRCDLQIFSSCVCHLEQLHAQSPFLFPIVFSINHFNTCHRSRSRFEINYLKHWGNLSGSIFTVLVPLAISMAIGNVYHSK